VVTVTALARYASAVDDVLDLPAGEQAALIAAGHISSEELVTAYLERIARIDPSVSAFTHVLARSARADARRKDARRRAGGAPLPPFHGVPLAVKDLNFARGSFTRMGSRAYRWFYSPFDDKVVAQLRRGGFVLLGKVATSELGALPVTEPDIHPPTRNPWRLDVTAGGSSGGSAAAVAARMAPIALASDGAGSIRIPSSFCHLYGLKPSRGRVPDPYGRPDQHAIASNGPIARTVADAAAMLDVMAGLSVGQPHWAPRPEAPLAELTRRDPGRLRIRFTTASPLVAAHPEVAAAVNRVAGLLAELGHEVAEGGPPEGEVEEFLPIWQQMIARAPILRAGVLQPVTLWLREAGKKLRPDQVHERQLELDRRIASWFGDADLWLTPTVAVAPPAIGAWRGLPPADAFARAAELGAFTALFNVSGQPAASIPAALSGEGWPIGVQLAGRPLADATVLAVSRQLEAALPWSAARPSL
jgi:amidase